MEKYITNPESKIKSMPQDRKFQTKLLDEDTQVIVKHFVDKDGNLRLNDPDVQVALFAIPGVRAALLTAATAREAEEANDSCGC